MQYFLLIPVIGTYLIFVQQAVVAYLSDEDIQRPNKARVKIY